MIVVSNTSPLTSLAAIDQFDLLRLLFDKLHVSQGVIDELSFGGTKWPGFNEAKGSDWVSIVPVKDQHLVDALRLELDRGEAETIALAIELKADLVLIDEKSGRFAAQHLGLKVMGIVGMIVEARRLKYISAARPLLDALRETAGFYINQALYDYVLQVVSES